MRTKLMRGVVLLAALATTGCPGAEDDDGGGTVTPTTTTHTGIISIQDVSLQGVPQARHGLSVNVLFTERRAPVFESEPGVATGCKAWVYDVANDPAPPLTDQGVITIDGLADGPYACTFDADSGYICPTSVGFGAVSVNVPAAGSASYTIEGAAFSASDVGRYLRVNGAMTKTNDGAFPIVAVTSPDTVLVANAVASAESFDSEYTVLAGGGPVPNNPSSPFALGSDVNVSIAPGGQKAFDFPEVGPIVPGGTFELDSASAAAISAVPLDGSSFSLGCGDCGAAEATLLRITTSDGDTTGLSPFAMPKPSKKHMEIQCANLGGDGTITLPAPILGLLALVNADAPVTRVRTAYMREGIGTAGAPNPVIVAVGHGVLGFTSP
jgi:hypothetical protein